MRGEKALALLLAGILASALAGCGSGNVPDGSVGSIPPEEITQANPSEDGGWTVYNCGGVKIGLPTAYLDQLIVDAAADGEEEVAYGGESLLSVSERDSVEAAQADFGSREGFGYVFGIERLTRGQYEQYVAGDHSGGSAFARDGETYYIFWTATDVQFYRSGGEAGTESADWQAWEALWDMGGAVRADMIARNGLTAYSDEEFYDQEFTYESAHAYVKYYPYWNRFESRDEFETLVLSQPVRQGQGGVWCVERWYDVYGTVCPVFPVTETGAAAYYKDMQAACDAGERSDVLTPLGAARLFTEEEYDHIPYAEGCLEATDGVDEAYFDLNRRMSQIAVNLYTSNGIEFSQEDLLKLIGEFRPDTWGVLGRFHYGSDWWTLLYAALQEIAVGTDQDLRDRNMIHLFLTYQKPDGPIAGGLAGILQRQREAAPEVFDNLLAGFSAAERAAVQAALDGGDR